MKGKDLPNGHHQLLCDDCKAEIFCDVNMVMLTDQAWQDVSKGADALCDLCIEKRLGRELTIYDLAPADNCWLGTSPANLAWLTGKLTGKDIDDIVIVNHKRQRGL